MQNGKLFATLKRHDSFSLCFGTKRAKKKGKEPLRKERSKIAGEIILKRVSRELFSLTHFSYWFWVCVSVCTHELLFPLSVKGEEFSIRKSFRFIYFPFSSSYTLDLIKWTLEIIYTSVRAGDRGKRNPREKRPSSRRLRMFSHEINRNLCKAGREKSCITFRIDTTLHNAEGADEKFTQSFPCFWRT